MTDTNQPLVEEDLSDLKRRSTRGAAMTFASQGLKFIITFGSQLIMAHLLTPAEFGLVAMAAPIMGLVAAFSDLGLSQATIQRKEITQRESTSLFWINIGISIALALILTALSPAISWIYHEPKVGPVIICLSGLVILGGLYSQSYALMNRHMQFKALALIDIAATLAGAAAGIGSVLLGAGYWALVIQQVANSVVMLVSVWFASGWRPSSPQFDPAVWSMLKFGGHLTAFNFINYVSSYFDNFLVGVFRGPFALGLFDRAFKLVLAPLFQVTMPISRIAVPLLSRISGSPDVYRRSYIGMLQGVLLLTAPGLACAATMADQVVLALLGTDWIGTAPILSWLSVSGMFAAFSSSTYWLFVSQGRTQEQMKCGFISSGLIILSMFAGLHGGPVGIAAAYAIFGPLIYGVHIWIAARTGPVTRLDILVAARPIALGIVASMLALHFLAHLFPFIAIANVLCGAVVSYLVTVAVLFIQPSGNRFIRELWNTRAMLRRGG